MNGSGGMNAMTCARAEDLLPLHTGGDLGADEARAVEAHLLACAGCREETAAWARSLGFVKEFGPAPFDESDYAEMRSAVRRKLAESATRKFTVRRVLNIFLEGKRGNALAFAAASLVLVAAFAMRPSRPAADPAAVSAAAPEPRSIALSGGAQAEAPLLLPSKKYPPDAPGTTSVVSVEAPRVPFSSKQKKLLSVRAAPASVVSRIELQTTNPNVRIIWLVGAQPARPPEANSENGI